ncbi:MAG: DinB family protein [Thermoanaerobaculia bacterium]
MIPAAEVLIAELEQEAPATRRVLARVPEEHLDFRPHPKSMSLAQLAQHVATIPGAIARLGALDGMDASQAKFMPEPAPSAASLLPTLEAALAGAKSFLAELTAERALAPWRMTAGKREVFSLPRIGMMRSIGMNHWYHHRGQLLVYLRLLDVPVPVVYGRTADENPFAAVN